MIYNWWKISSVTSHCRRDAIVRSSIPSYHVCQGSWIDYCYITFASESESTIKNVPVQSGNVIWLVLQWVLRNLIQLAKRIIYHMEASKFVLQRGGMFGELTAPEGAVGRKTIFQRNQCHHSIPINSHTVRQRPLGDKTCPEERSVPHRRHLGKKSGVCGRNRWTIPS